MQFEKKEFSKKRDYDSYVLGGDVGGTNTSLVIAGIDNDKINLIFSLHYKTKDLKNFESAVDHAVKYAKDNYGISLKNACFAVAGVVKDHNSAWLTNIKWNVDSKEILKKTSLENIHIINDFEAIGYGVNVLPDSDLVKINNAKPEKGRTKAVIGAGTGLGVSILFYDEEKDCYIPMPSEGGHETFSVENDEEQELVEFIKSKFKIKEQLINEFLLSGPGLERIYEFYKSTLGESKITKEIDNSPEKPAVISKYRKKDKVCKKTFETFTRAYARAAKNLAVTTLPFSGLYIAGGIAEKNKDIISSKIFLDEFYNHTTRSLQLKKFPIFLIKNYDVSLYGSCYCALIKF